MARPYDMYGFLGIVTAFAILWASVGTALYGCRLDSLGWNKMSFEARWTLFIGLSLLAAAMTAALIIGVFQLFVRIRRSFQSSNPPAE